MEIIEVGKIDENLLSTFLAEADGQKSRMSALASTQTGNDRVVTRERIAYLKESSDHLMLLCVDAENLVGMVVGQRVTGINNSYMYVHDIVVDPETRGGGIGSKLMQALLDGGVEKWPEIVRIQLTSRPERGTGTFFQKFGFRARTKESGDETIVYVKDIGDYRS